MTTKRLKRPRDPVQLGKLVGDILTGQVEDKGPPKDEAKRVKSEAVNPSKKSVSTTRRRAT